MLLIALKKHRPSVWPASFLHVPTACYSKAPLTACFMAHITHLRLLTFSPGATLPARREVKSKKKNNNVDNVGRREVTSKMN